MSSGKRKRDEYPGQLPSGSFVPQQDGSADQIVEFFVSKVVIQVDFTLMNYISMF
jgi:transcription initiation factor TFIIA large subunit